MGWIGKVVFPDGPEAVLGDDGVWRCADPDEATILNARFDPRRADGNPLAPLMPAGFVAVSEAAARLGGRAEFAVDYHAPPALEDPAALDEFAPRPGQGEEPST